MSSHPAHASQLAAAPAHPGGRGFTGLVAPAGLGWSCAQADADAGRRLAPSDLKMAGRLDHGIGRLACEVGGTPQHRNRQVAVALAAPTDLQPLRQQSRRVRVRDLDLLAAPVIDRGALAQARLAPDSAGGRQEPCAAAPGPTPPRSDDPGAAHRTGHA